MHTHHMSGNMFLANGLNILLFLTIWKLAWFHVARLTGPTGRALASAAFFQAS